MLIEQPPGPAKLQPGVMRTFETSNAVVIAADKIRGPRIM